MSRVSPVVFSTLVAAVVYATSGCALKVEAETKERFIQENVSPAGADWNGEAIKIDDAAVGASVNGGLEIIAEAGRTKVEASARILAMAKKTEQSQAQLTLDEVKAGFTITNSGGTITVFCGHGQAHGSSEAGLSGCERLIVRVPAGDTTNPLTLSGVVGNGGIKVSAANATIASLAVISNGGDVEVTAAATKGAVIAADSQKADDVTIRLPANFAADLITLNADAASIDTTAFPGVQSGSGRGTAGEGAKSINLTSRTFAGSTGKVILAQ